MFVITQILHLSLRTDHGLFLSRHSQILLFFPHGNVCQPSSLQSKLRSSKTRLKWLQTVIDGQESRRTLDKMSKLHRSRLDTSLCTRRSGSSQLASDETLSRTACTGTEVHCKPTRSVDQLCEMCPSSTLHSSTHCSNDVSVDPVIGFSAGGSEANVTFERQRLHGEGGEGHDYRKRGTEASKEESDTTNDDRVEHFLQIFWQDRQSSRLCADFSPQLHITEIQLLSEIVTVHFINHRCQVTQNQCMWSQHRKHSWTLPRYGFARKLVKDSRFHLRPGEYSQHTENQRHEPQPAEIRSFDVREETYTTI